MKEVLPQPIFNKQNKLDTLRLMTTLLCNYDCWYCCNKQEEYNKYFEYLQLKDIIDELPHYENICVSGGEPFFPPNLQLTYKILENTTEIQNVYIYTNAVLISDEILDKLLSYPQIKCLNVGLHGKAQIKRINKRIGKEIPVRWMFWKELGIEFNDRIRNDNSKPWELNVCNVLGRERWVVLK